jgi:hypothetical protein
MDLGERQGVRTPYSAPLLADKIRSDCTAYGRPCVDRVGTPSAQCEEATLARAEALCAIGTMTYWKRMWIVQELLLSDPVGILGTDIVIPLQVIVWLVDDLLEDDAAPPPMSRSRHAFHYTLPPGMIDRLESLPARKIWGAMFQQQTRRIFMIQAVRDFEGAQCSDSRDRVFSCLSFVDGPCATLKPDYTKSIAEVVLMVLCLESSSLCSISQSDVVSMLRSLHFTFDSLLSAASRLVSQSVRPSTTPEQISGHMDELYSRMWAFRPLSWVIFRRLRSGEGSAFCLQCVVDRGERGAAIPCKYRVHEQPSQRQGSGDAGDLRAGDIILILPVPWVNSADDEFGIVAQPAAGSKSMRMLEIIRLQRNLETRPCLCSLHLEGFVIQSHLDDHLSIGKIVCGEGSLERSGGRIQLTRPFRIVPDSPLSGTTTLVGTDVCYDGRYMR